MSKIGNANAQAEMSNQYSDKVAHDLMKMGSLSPSVSMLDYINSSAPYEFRISFTAHKEMRGWRYVRFLRRLVKSVNLRLMRNAGFPNIAGYAVLEMFDGVVIVQSHAARPTVEIVCNINQRYNSVRPADVSNAFASTACYESIAKRIPIFDRESLKVEMLPSGKWNSELEDDGPCVFKLTGSRMYSSRNYEHIFNGSMFGLLIR